MTGRPVTEPTPERSVAGGRRDRDEVFLEYTKSICPVCKVVVDAQVNVREDKVYLRKRCAEHGWFEALVYGDAQAYLASARFNKPGTIPLAFQTEVRDGCPSDCGLCPEHKQHACLGIIEVNTGCNLDCPVCFADSGHQPDGYAITAAQCERMLDAFVAAEGEPEVVMFSGGEPTIHKNIVEFIDLAQSRPIRTVTLNTNGIRLAADARFAAALGQRNRPGKAVTIYLQFDGLTESTHLAVRGRDLREVKQRALDACAAAGLTVTLVAAIERGVNEHEVGDIIEFGLAHPAVRSVSFQPVTHSGRHPQFDPLTRLTNSDVIELIAAQRPEWFAKDDFFPVPCCFPACRSVTYLLTEGTPGQPGFGVLPVPRLLRVEDYLDYVSRPDHLGILACPPGVVTDVVEGDLRIDGHDTGRARRRNRPLANSGTNLPAVRHISPVPVTMLTISAARSPPAGFPIEARRHARDTRRTHGLPVPGRRPGRGRGCAPACGGASGCAARRLRPGPREGRPGGPSCPAPRFG